MTAVALDAERTDSGLYVCRPRWATPRNLDRPTYGPKVAKVAETLGRPFMPWQHESADVALEVDPATGELVYRTVIITVPRQSGKTTELLSVMVWRCNWRPMQNVTYTAQTRIAAREKWEDEHEPLIKGSAFAPLVKVRKTTGAEAFVWSNTHSKQGLISATKKSGHGTTLDMGVIDEAFAQTDDRLEQAFRPAGITRKSFQLWIISTAGTLAESPYLYSKVTSGRLLVESGDPSSTCYIEYSAPDDADPLDHATWWACMPALGHTITEAAVEAELQSFLAEHGPDGLDLFRRAYLNQWPDQVARAWAVISSVSWRARAGAEGRPEGRPVFGVSAAWPYAETGSITSVARHGDEVYIQVVDHRPGTSWMPGRLRELRDRWDPAATVMDEKDPAAAEKTAIEAAGVPLTILNQTQLGQAHAMLINSVRGDRPYLRHYSQQALDDAVAGAQSRPLGDAHVWARRGVADISPLVGGSNALYVLSLAPTPTPAPNIF